MCSDPVKVLAIYPDVAPGAELEDAVAQVADEYEVVWATAIDRALELAEDHAIEAVVLRLPWPGEDGLAPFVTVRQALPEAALVVVSPAESEALALKATDLGAQDYLVEDSVHGVLFRRCIGHAIEVRRLQGEVEKRGREWESKLAVRFEESGGSRPAGGRPKEASLRVAFPQLFAACVDDYSRLLEDATEQLYYRIEHDIAGGLRDLAERLADVMAGPKDVVAVHASALRQRSSEGSASKAAVYTREGRLMLLELMGYLASHYRGRIPGRYRASRPRGDS